MAAILPIASEQFGTVGTAGTTVKSDPFDDAPMKVSYSIFTCTQAGTGTVTMVRLPAGLIRVHTEHCRYTASDMAAGADLHIGHAAYTNQAGVAQAADDNLWGDNIDIGGGADANLVFPLPAAPAPPIEFDTRDGLDVQVLIDTGDCDLTDTVELWIYYQHA